MPPNGEKYLEDAVMIL